MNSVSSRQELEYFHYKIRYSRFTLGAAAFRLWSSVFALVFVSVQWR